MSSSRVYKIGYGCPPEETRWKEGQCGNPTRRYRTQPFSKLEKIDKHLLRLIEVVGNDGIKRKVRALELILRNLLQQELAGSRRALIIRLKYESIAQEVERGKLEVKLIENDYTRALAAGLPVEDSDDE